MSQEVKIVSPSQVIGLTFSNPPLSFRGSEEGKIIHARLIREVNERDGQFISSPDHPGIAQILNQYPTKPLFREKLRTVPVNETTSLRARPDLATPDVCIEIKPGPPTYRNLLQACLGTMVLTPQGRETDGASIHIKPKKLFSFLRVT